VYLGASYTLLMIFQLLKKFGWVIVKIRNSLLKLDRAMWTNFLFFFLFSLKTSTMGVEEMIRLCAKFNCS
jgi:hypothetical protein